MSSKLKGLKITPKKRSKETNPLKIFETLTLRGTIENIWDPQSEASNYQSPGTFRYVEQRQLSFVEYPRPGTRMAGSIAVADPVRVK